MRECALDLVDAGPDVIMAVGGTVLAQLLQVTHSVPVVFTVVPDPVGAGFVESLARPGGNTTGFLQFEFGIGAKWLEVLKEVSPQVSRVGVIRDPTISAGLGQFGAIQSIAPAFRVEINPIDARNTRDIERGIEAFVQHSGDEGLIITASAMATINRDFIIALALQHKLPAVYFADLFVKAGGLASYGPNLIDQTRQSAAYVHRILMGEKPADLPVQAPTKYDLAINLKTAKALGLTVPQLLLARADEVIE
jgi:putative tryptophan/tyrosine transport system substrate-binding protein